MNDSRSNAAEASPFVALSLDLALVEAVSVTSNERSPCPIDALCSAAVPNFHRGTGTGVSTVSASVARMPAQAIAALAAGLRRNATAESTIASAPTTSAWAQHHASDMRM
jgi:hypothetical protein